jgi:colicin import membrane protein
MRRSFAASYPSHSLPTGVLSVLVHALFLALLFFGLDWQNHPPEPVQAELWSGMPPPAKVVKAEPVVPVVPVEPADETPASAPEPEHVKKPAPAIPAPTRASSSVTKPDIATEREKKTKDLVAKKIEDELREIELKKAQQDAKLREIDREQKEKQKSEAALKEQALKAQAQKEQADEKRLAQLQRDADARAAQTQSDANINVLKSFSERIKAKIKSNTIVSPSVTSGASATVKFVVLPDGSVLEGSIRVVQSSGQNAYDESIKRAIIASQPLPLPDDLVLRRELRDLSITFTNI